MWERLHRIKMGLRGRGSNAQIPPVFRTLRGWEGEEEGLRTTRPGGGGGECMAARSFGTAHVPVWLGGASVGLMACDA